MCVSLISYIYPLNLRIFLSFINFSNFNLSKHLSAFLIFLLNRFTDSISIVKLEYL